MALYRQNRNEILLPQVRFLDEQKGPPELELEARLCTLFLHEDVEKAYLAQVVYGNESNVSVALCLRAKTANQKDLVEKVGKVFGALFGRDQHLDIIFVSDSQVAGLEKVCRAFYNASRTEVIG